ncbi:MAG: Superoxide dismutase-like protein YojM [Elusimicrobia bacterium]|nr:Superoxide dismutase-like protein YojM [Elusimicrobiota bacterium]
MIRTATPFIVFSVLLMQSPLWSASGLATILGTKEGSDISGELKFEDTKTGLKISGTIDNIPSGNHGFHIHDFGDCRDEGKNAGGHFNPDQKPHGHVMKEGSSKVHPGDMGNITADEKGMAVVDVTLPGVTLVGGKYSVAGRAVIVHEKEDDFGQPTGNAGGRIACGPILLTGK